MSTYGGRSNLIDIACIIVHETEKAYLIDHGGKEKVWIPKSQCEYDQHDKTMAMPEYIAKEKGII
jgi:hypothetical protein